MQTIHERGFSNAALRIGLCFGLLVFAACDDAPRRRGGGGGGDGEIPNDTPGNPTTEPNRDDEQPPDDLPPATPPGPPILEDGTPFSDWVPRSDCPPGQMPEFGRDGCVWVGAPCPEGDWPEGLPAEGVVYVHPTGTGDGSHPDTPMGPEDMQRALLGDPLGEESPQSKTFALSKGHYESTLVFGSWGQVAEFLSEIGLPTPTTHVSIVGACARDTIIVPSPIVDGEESEVSLDDLLQAFNEATGAFPQNTFNGTDGTIELNISGTLQNITVQGKKWGIKTSYDNRRTVDEPQHISLIGVIVEGGENGGVYAQNATMDSVLIRNTGGSPNTCCGAVVLNGNLTNILIEDTVGTGLVVSGTSGEKIAVLGTQPGPNGDWGYGLLFYGEEDDTPFSSPFSEFNSNVDATVSLERVFIDGAHGAGLISWVNWLFQKVPKFLAQDVVVRNTKPLACSLPDSPFSQCELGFGDGVVVHGGGGELSIRRISVVDNARIGIHAYDFLGSAREIADEARGFGAWIRDCAGYDGCVNAVSEMGGGFHDSRSVTPGEYCEIWAEGGIESDFEPSPDAVAEMDNMMSCLVCLDMGWAACNLAVCSSETEVFRQCAQANGCSASYWLDGEHRRRSGTLRRDIMDPWPESYRDPCMRGPCGAARTAWIECMDGVSDEDFQAHCDPGFVDCYPLIAPKILLEEGQIIRNAIGINLRASTVSPEDFSAVVCKDNPDSEDGCFATADRRVPPVQDVIAQVPIPSSDEDEGEE